MHRILPRLIAVVVCVMAFSLVFAETAAAATGVPRIMNYQGRLMNSSGSLLGGSSGTDYCVKFSLYDDAAVGGADTKLWPSGSPSTMTVNVKTGIFNAGVGDTNAGGDALNFDFESYDAVYLNVEVASKVGATCAPGDGAESFENLSPRQRVTASGYAINSATLGGQTGAFYRANSYSTTSAAYDLSTYDKGYFFSTTSVNYWNSTVGAWATTSSDAWFATKTTDQLTQGVSNLYYSNNLVNAFIGGSSTIPKTFTGNTFTGVNSFTNDVSLTNATTSNFNILNTISGAGLTSCSGSADKLVWNATTRQFACGADAGAGGGVTALGAQYSVFQTGASQTFATSSDANIGMTITSSGDTHTFTPTWTGTLSGQRGGTGIGSVTQNGILIGAAGNTWSQVSTSSLGLPTFATLSSYLGLAAWYATTTDALAEGSTNKYFTTNRVAEVIAATTTDALAEGSTNKYYNDSRVQTYLNTVNKGFFFSTTSASQFASVGLAFSTTSAQYFLEQNGGGASFSTTSASYFSSLGLAYSTTSAAFNLSTYDKGYFFSTTSVAYWDSTQFRWATTSSDAWFATKSTTDLPEGTNLYYTPNRVAGVIAGTTTDALAEGSNNKYFTNNRVASVIAATTTDALAEGATNRYYSNGLVQTYLNGVDKGYFFSTTSALYFNAQNPGASFSTSSADYWKTQNNFHSTTSFAFNLATYDKGYFFSTTSVNYWESTQNRWATTSTDAWFATKSTSDLPEGTNLYYTPNRVASVIAGTTTDALAEGSNNKYFTNNRVAEVIAATTTDALAEGSTNKYYNDSRVQTYLNGVSKGFFFSTTSASVFSANGLAFSTTSTDYWKSVNNFFSTTSASHFSSLGLAFSTTSASYFLGQNLGQAFSTSSTDYYMQSSTTVPTTYKNNTFTGTNSFQNVTATNATTTTSFSGTASSSNLFSNVATIGSLIAGVFTGNVITATNATTTTLYTGTASSTNSYSNTATVGSATIGAASVNSLTLGNALTGANGGTGLNTVTQNALLIGGAGNTWTQVSTSSLGLVAFGDLGAYMGLAQWYATTTDALAEGSNNKYFTVNRVAAALSATTTDALAEGSTNKYFTTNRVAEVIAATTTDALAEGSTNKYYNDSRVQTYLNTVNKGFFFSTTSTDAWLNTKTFASFSTTSADYWKTQNNFHSTTSFAFNLASYDPGYFFSTTSVNYWESTQYRWATTSTDAWFATKTTTNLPEGTNLYYTPNRVAGVIAGTTTDALAEGSNNKYFTNNRVASVIAATTTDALAEGATNRYYSNGLVQTYLNGIDKGFYFSTTSSDAWLNTKTFASFSTTSADYWKTQNNFHSTTSFAFNLATYDKGYFFSTTSVNYWESTQNRWATTSSDAWFATKSTSDLPEGTNLYYTPNRVAGVIAGTTTDALAEGTTNRYFSNGLVDQYLAASSSVPKTFSNNTFSGTNSFQNITATGATTTSLSTGIASTTNLTVSGVSNGLLGTGANGVVQATTFSGPLSYNGGILTLTQSGAAQNGYVSSTDWNSFNSRLSTSTLALVDKGFFFSTTSASNFAAAGLAFSTTSTDYYKSVNNFFSTTSASVFSANGLSFSTTSTDYWKSVNNFFSTTSASHFSALGLAFSTTSASYFLGQNLGQAFSTTSQNYYMQSSTTVPTTYKDNTFTGANSFANITFVQGTSTSFFSNILSAAGALFGSFQSTSTTATSTIAGPVAFGTTTTSYKYSFMGQTTGATGATGTAIVAISNDNNTLSSGNNVLRLNLRTAYATACTSATTCPRFEEYFTGVPSGSDTGGRSVGSLRLSTAGTGITQTSGAADFAEYMQLSESAAVGDIVSLNSNGEYRKAVAGESLIGVISDNPAFVGNAGLEGQPNAYIVGFAGVIRTTVSTANGTINAGDLIAASDVPGVGIKLSKSGYALGQALQSWSGPGTGQISILVLPKYVDAAVALESYGGGASGASGYWDLSTSTNTVSLASSTYSVQIGTSASTSNLVVSNGFTFGKGSGVLKSVAGVVSSALVNLATDVTGILGISNGGTGTSTAPANGQILVGNATGGYDLVAASSLIAQNQGNAFSTTSTNYWKTQNNFFSTTSASVFSANGLAFSTTSTDYWRSVNNFFSTTSASHFSALGLAFSTTSASYFLSLNDSSFSTTSANYYAQSSTTVPTTYKNNTFTGTNSFQNITATGATTTALNTNTASTSNLVISTLQNSMLYTGPGGVVSAATVSGPLSFSAGTLSIQTASAAQAGALAAADFSSFNSRLSTSSLGLIDKGFFFSTTSSDFWKTQTNFFSTTSTDFWKTQNNFFSTTSASHFSSLGLAFSTTSAAYFLGQNQGAAFSTTSASNFAAAGLAFSTTSANYYTSQNQGASFSTTSQNYYMQSSTTVPTTYKNNTYTGTNSFQNITATGATTTSLSTGIASTTNLTVSGVSNGLLGTGANGVVQATTFSGPLSYNGGILTLTQSGAAQNGYVSSTDWNSFNSRLSTSTLALVDKGFFFSTTSAQYFTSIGFGFSTTSSDAHIAASSSVVTTYKNNTFIGVNAFANITVTGATTTSIFSSVASSTNIFSTSARFGSLGGFSLTGSVAAAANSITGINIASTTDLWISNVRNGLLATNGQGNVVASSTPTASSFNATSNTVASQLPYASTTALSALQMLSIGAANGTILQGNASGTSTIAGFINVTGTNSTSTFSGGVSASRLNITGNSTSTSAWGFNINNGCYAINGVCISGAVNSVTATNTTLTVNPNAGNVGISLNLSNPNLWTGLQQFANATSSLLEATQFYARTIQSTSSNALVLQSNFSSTAGLTFGSTSTPSTLVIDTINNRVRIGTQAGGTPNLLVIDSKNTAGDPTGVAGAMYYNSNVGAFRCFASSWVTCGGQAASSTGDVQFRNIDGSFTATSNFNWSQVGNGLTLTGSSTTQTLDLLTIASSSGRAMFGVSGMGVVTLATTTDPTTPPSGELNLYAKEIAGRVLPKWIGPSGVDTPIQANFGFNKIALAQSAGAALTATGVTLTNVGTLSAGALSTASLKQSVRRTTNTSAAGAGSLASNRSSATMVTRGNATGIGGYFMTMRFGLTTLQAGQRGFYGISDSIAAPTNVDPTTSNVIGKVGLMFNANTGNWKFGWNVAGTAPSVYDLGANFPINTTDLYELIIFVKPNDTVMTYRVKNLSTGAEVSSTTASTNIPGNTTFVAPMMWMTNNATAAAVAYDIVGWYLESDN